MSNGSADSGGQSNTDSDDREPTKKRKSRASRFKEFSEQLDRDAAADAEEDSTEGGDRASAADSWEWLGDRSDSEAGDTDTAEPDTDSSEGGTDTSDDPERRSGDRVWGTMEDPDGRSAPTTDPTPTKPGQTSEDADASDKARPATGDETGSDADDELTDFFRGGTVREQPADESPLRDESADKSEPVPDEPEPTAEEPGVAADPDRLTAESPAVRQPSETATTPEESEAEPRPESAAESADTTSESTAAKPESSGESARTPDGTERKRRIWDADADGEPTTDASSTAQESAESPAKQTGDIPAAESTSGGPGGGSTDGSPFDQGDDGGYTRPDGLSLTPGSSVLVQCGAQDENRHAATLDLLGVSADVDSRNVLLVQYRQIDRGLLTQIADWAAEMTVIAVGYSQPIPDELDDTVETITINNPNDITRLGIVMSGTLDGWKTSSNEAAVSFNSLNVLLEYTDAKRTFRFLHVLLGTLRERNTIAQFHVDTMAADVQDVNTLKPLFDSVISIDSMGTHLE